MPFTSQPLRDALGFGVLVTGLAARDIALPDVRQQLHDLWIDCGLIVFRGLPDDPDTQIALSEVFGRPDVHPLKQTTNQGDIQKLVDIFFRPERGDIVKLADGQRLGAWLPWHFDLVYMDRINHGGILRPVTLPESGGDTGFIDGLAAYQRLPDRLKEEIEDLHVIYRFDGDLAGLHFGRTPGLVLERMNVGTSEIMDRLDRFPAVSHPLVFNQPETGRKVLNFSPWFSLGIEGMDQQESARILEDVTRHLIDENRAYFHRWLPGDMVLWDNWRMIHCATGIPIDQQRHMQRTTIAGDYGLGRKVQ